MTALRAPGLVAKYYLATPLFAAADLGFGVPVRLAGLLPTWQRAAYYLVAFALGFLCASRPRTAPWVGMAESVVNLFLLLLGILLPIWSMGDAALAGAPLQGGLTLPAAANALLSGTALTVSFRRHQDAALGGSGIKRHGVGL